MSRGNITPDSIFKLFSNYTALTSFNEVISSNGGDMTKLKDEIIDLQKEMFFGKTMLPVYKVYGHLPLKKSLMIIWVVQKNLQTKKDPILIK